MEENALIFDVKRNCSEDGPGIRTTVFFKGCPLSCVWCQNPEGMGVRPSISFRSASCHPVRCGAPCVRVCPVNALRLRAPLEIDRGACTRCEECFAVCPTQAVEPVGYEASMDGLVYKVLIDRPFFDATGGGVTASGGEATLQMSFLSRFLKRLQEEGVHTALETCGFFHLERFRELVLPHLNLLYFDLKLFDDEASRRYVGQSSQRILSNLSKLVKEPGIPIVPRIALIPGITDTERNLSSLAGFLRDHGVKSCRLLRYNPLWVDKVGRLGVTPRYRHRGFMSRERESACVHHLNQALESANGRTLWCEGNEAGAM